MKPYNPQKFVPDMCKIAYNLTLKWIRIYILHVFIIVSSVVQHIVRSRVYSVDPQSRLVPKLQIDLKTLSFG